MQREPNHGFRRYVSAMLLGALMALAACSHAPSEEEKAKAEAAYDPYAETPMAGAEFPGKVKRTDPIDRDMNMDRDDYDSAVYDREKYVKAMEAAEKYKKGGKEVPPIPEVSDILTSPRAARVGADKMVSLSITDEVPIKDVLLELGRLANIDMEIDSGIKGGIILNVKDKPLSDVIDRVADLAGLKYEMKNGVMRVRRDLPYVKNYPVDFLNLVRSNTGSINISTAVLASSGESSGGLDSGSSNAISSSYEGDVWTAVENTISNILKFNAESLSSSAEIEAQATGTDDTALTASVTLNKPAGVISVLGTDKQHKDVAAYLKEVQKTIAAQVLIEAKVVEVTLSDEYKTGINWDLLEKNKQVGVTGTFTEKIADTSDVLTFSLLNGDRSSIAAAVSLTDAFGVSRTLSSPRLHAMNNQQAVLTFAENKVYFTVEAEESESTDTSTTTSTLNITSTLNTVPIGMILTLQPSINLDTSEITMNIRPTLSRITEEVADPAVQIIAERNDVTDVTSEIPVIEVREMDTVLKVKSGQIMVIGGLMEERSVNNDRGVPGLSRIPILGNAFKGVEKTTETVETVIFLKGTIIPSNDGKVSKEDQFFYKTFTRDPHPLAF